jgi:hypothetical protein
MSNIEIKECRICKSKNLTDILRLGNQPLSGVFPKINQSDPISGPLTLVVCNNCELLQLKNSYPLTEMYGMNYGYRSGLNSSMVTHLDRITDLVSKFANNKDTVLDIGSNDGTLLNSYASKGEFKRVGIDPTAQKFQKFYDKDISVIPDFFSADKFLANNSGAKVVTSVAMFYDLESPVDFAIDVHNCLTPEGIWYSEQLYLPFMFQSMAYDAINHEHLEYYSLRNMVDICNRANLKILDVGTNDTNGGSIYFIAARQNSHHTVSPIVNWFLELEKNFYKLNVETYFDFANKVKNHRDKFCDLISILRGGGKNIWGIGASTKGNILLNYCNFTSTEIQGISDVNSDKYESVTPGSRIRIHSETEMRRNKPDYAIVLPWHFRSSIIDKEQDYIKSGGKLIFPMPRIEIVTS